MKGFWRHIAASASITAVFLICALAVAVSAVPVAAPSTHASRSSQGRSLADSLTSVFEILDTVCEEAPQQASAAPDPEAEAAAQPAPATAAPAGAGQPALLLPSCNPWLPTIN